MIVLVGMLVGCNQAKREATLQREVDSLKTELTISSELNSTLEEVGVLIDSIDASRNFLRNSMIDGLPHDSYAARLTEINTFVKTSYIKMEDLEKALKESKRAGTKASASLTRLKKDLEEKTRELELMSAAVAHYKSANDSLSSTLNLQSAELNDKLEQLTARQEEIAMLEDRVKEVVAQAKYDMADAYYLRAQALEEAARRTNFAPKKKKSTKQEALELYRLAALSGKEEAAQKVKELEN